MRVRAKTAQAAVAVSSLDAMYELELKIARALSDRCPELRLLPRRAPTSSSPMFAVNSMVRKRLAVSRRNIQPHQSMGEARKQYQISGPLWAASQMFVNRTSLASWTSAPSCCRPHRCNACDSDRPLS